MIRKDENGFFIFSLIASALTAVLITTTTEISFLLSLLLYNTVGLVVYKLKEAIYIGNNSQGNIWEVLYFPVILWPLTIIYNATNMLFVIKDILWKTEKTNSVNEKRFAQAIMAKANL